MEKPNKCEKCGEKDMIIFAKSITASGSINYYWWCTNKDWESANSQYIARYTFEHNPLKNACFISHSIIPEEMKKSARLVNDNVAQNPDCAFCGDPYTEFNHIMPQAISALLLRKEEYWDINFEVGVWLCPKCHRNIFHRFVTPYQLPHKDPKFLGYLVAKNYTKLERKLLEDSIDKYLTT